MVAADENQAQLDPHRADSQETSEPAAIGATEKSDRTAASDIGLDSRAPNNLDFVLDIPIEVTIELGRTKMLVGELLKLGQGSVLELAKLAGETMEILANKKLIARGEVVVVNEKYGVRLTEVISPTERIERLR